MMTLDAVTKKNRAEPSAEQQAAVELVRLAQEQDLLNRNDSRSPSVILRCSIPSASVVVV